MIRKIFITGATGFIGKAIVNRLNIASIDLFAPVRNDGRSLPTGVRPLQIDDVADLPKVLAGLNGINEVIHIAGLAHLQSASLSEFRKINTEATLKLAKVAVANGIKRFIFMSSIGVNGINNIKPFSVEDTPVPVESYAISKFEAELGLREIAHETGMEVVIIRPPLVYGPCAPGNFEKLAKLVQKNLPLPLGAINNKRSLVALDNLIDLIVTCLEHPMAANQIFLVSDDNDVSTTELIKLMAGAAGKKPRLLPVPETWLRLIGKLTGKTGVVDRLCGNLQVDIAHTKNTLGWTPPISLKCGLARCFAKNNGCSN